MTDYKDSYVGVIKVERVRRPVDSSGQPPALTMSRHSTEPTKRQVIDVTHLTIKADTIAGLQVKLKAHIDLIDSEGTDSE